MCLFVALPSIRTRHCRVRFLPASERRKPYGCFYDKPYPTLLGRALGPDVLNLAVGGTGPGFYTQYESLIRAMNRGRFVVLQCMAARHESNSQVEADGYVEFVKDRKTGVSRPGWDFWNHVLRTDLANVERYAQETRASWIETTRKLVSMIEVPVIFFWYARRKPDYSIDMNAIKEQLSRPPVNAVEQTFVAGLTSDFPHLVDGPSARAAIALCDAYAECLSNRGMGQVLLNRFTGKPMGNVDNTALGDQFKQQAQTHNIYYPSAEMHEDACEALLPVARAIVAG